MIATSPLGVDALGWIWLVTSATAFLLPILRVNKQAQWGRVWQQRRTGGGTTIMEPRDTCNCGVECLYEFAVTYFVGMGAIFFACSLLYGATQMPAVTAEEDASVSSKANVLLGIAALLAAPLSLAGRPSWIVYAGWLIGALIVAGVKDRSAALPEGDGFTVVPIGIVIALFAVFIFLLTLFARAEWLPHALAIALVAALAGNTVAGDWPRILRAYRTDLTWPLIEAALVFVAYALYEQRIYKYLSGGWWGSGGSRSSGGGGVVVEGGG